MERLKQKVALSRVFASLQQVAAGGTAPAGPNSGAPGQAQATTGQPSQAAPARAIPEAAMSTAWLMAADATAHLTDEEKGILLEVFKKEEQFQRDTIKQLTASRQQLASGSEPPATLHALNNNNNNSRPYATQTAAASSKPAPGRNRQQHHHQHQLQAHNRNNQSTSLGPSAFVNSMSSATPTSSTQSSRACSCTTASCGHATPIMANTSSTATSSVGEFQLVGRAQTRAQSRASTLSSNATCGASLSDSGAATAANHNDDNGNKSSNNDQSSNATTGGQAAVSSLGQCRICRKTIEPSEPCHLCSNCNQFICDDCASYSTSDQFWMCSSCRRRALNPPIPAEALKELGLNQNSSAVRRMTLRLNQNELKLAASKCGLETSSSSTSSSASHSHSSASSSSSNAQRALGGPFPKRVAAEPGSSATTTPLAENKRLLAKQNIVRQQQQQQQQAAVPTARRLLDQATGPGSAGERPTGQAALAQLQRQGSVARDNFVIKNEQSVGSATAGKPLKRVSSLQQKRICAQKTMSQPVARCEPAEVQPTQQQQPWAQPHQSWRPAQKLAPARTGQLKEPASQQQQWLDQPAPSRPQQEADHLQQAMMQTMLSESGQQQLIETMIDKHRSSLALASGAPKAAAIDSYLLQAKSANLIPIPPEQMHLRRLSDQSNLVRRSSIIASNMFDGTINIARNRSHSNIDSVAYLQMAAASDGYCQLGASGQPLQMPSDEQSRAAHAYELQRLAQISGGARALNSASSSSLHHLQLQPTSGQLLTQQRRLSDGGQYFTADPTATQSVNAEQTGGQHIASVVTSYAHKRRQQQQHQRSRQSTEDLYHSDSSSDFELVPGPCERRAAKGAPLPSSSQQQPISIPSVSVSEFAAAAARRRSSIHLQQQQQQQQQQARRQQPLIQSPGHFQADNQITPMQINVAIEQVIQQQQERESAAQLVPNRANQLEALLFRRGSSGRVLPNIPGGQHSRSLLELPGGRGNADQQQAQQRGEQRLSGASSVGASRNGSAAGHDTLGLPCPSPTVRRASAPEGQIIKIVVDDIDESYGAHYGQIARNGFHQHQNAYQQQKQQMQLGDGTWLRDERLGGRALDQATGGSGTFDVKRRRSTALVSAGSAPASFLERHILYRDDTLDPSGLHVGRGFGLQVTGGKLDKAGKLHAIVNWVLPGGPADKAGLRAGDKLIEWDGKCLVNMSYEQVAEVIESSANIAEIVVKPSAQRLRRELSAATAANASGQLQASSSGAYLRSQRRLSQQTERDLRRQQQPVEMGAGAQIGPPKHQSSSGSHQQSGAANGRLGTGRRLPQIPGCLGRGGAPSVTTSAAASNQHPQQMQAAPISIRHASTGDLDQQNNALSLGNLVNAQTGNAPFMSLSGNHLNAAAFQQLNGGETGQQSRSAGELHRGSLTTLPNYSATQAVAPAISYGESNHTQTGASLLSTEWFSSSQQYGGSQQIAPGPGHPQAYNGTGLTNGCNNSFNTLNASAQDEPSGHIGLQVLVDERVNSLEISILSAHNIERNPSLDYVVKLRILPESNRFRVCTSQPSADMNWKETFLFQNFPTKKLHKMALEIGLWVHDDSPRLTTQVAQPICEALIPIQSARERHIDFWPLRPPPSSPQARRKSLNDLIGNHRDQDELEGAHLSAGYQQTTFNLHDQTIAIPSSLQRQTGAGRDRWSAQFGSVAQVSNAGLVGDSIQKSNYQRERSSSNRNLQDTNKLHIQPRRASDEVAMSSSQRLLSRLSPAASRRSISVMNVGDGPGRSSGSRLGSQANIFKAAQMRRDSSQASQQRDAQQQVTGNTNKFSAGTTEPPVSSPARTDFPTPTGRRSSTVGYRSQKSSQSDATDQDSPHSSMKRSREATFSLAQQQHHQTSTSRALDGHDRSRAGGPTGEQ